MRFAIIRRASRLRNALEDMRMRSKGITVENQELTLSVIIPCYNEKQTLETILNRVKAVGLAS